MKICEKNVKWVCNMGKERKKSGLSWFDVSQNLCFESGFRQILRLKLNILTQIVFVLIVLPFSHLFVEFNWSNHRNLRQISRKIFYTYTLCLYRRHFTSVLGMIKLLYTREFHNENNRLVNITKSSLKSFQTFLSTWICFLIKEFIVWLKIVWFITKIYSKI